MKFNLHKLLLAIFLALPGIKAAKPGVPSLSYQELTFSLVEVSHETVAYKGLIKKQVDSVPITVRWEVWSGGQATEAHILLNGETFWSGSASGNSATFNMNKGGKYQMSVKICNSDGCSESASKEMLVADTDGSHIANIPGVGFHENNKAYQNSTGHIVATYFVEWGVYGRKYPADKLPVDNLTHLLYGFIPICGGDGLNDALKTIPNSFENLQKACAGTPDFEVAIHDPWAALQKPEEGLRNWSEPYKGTFGQIMGIKRQYPHLKVLPSIGGWTLSDPFFFLHDSAKRSTFVKSVRKFLKTWKFFDGADIDWEFPGGNGCNQNIGDKEKDGALYLTLMKELRAMLDDLGSEMGRRYMLTSAISVGEDKISVVPYEDAHPYMDNIFLMSYDFYGAWDQNELNHQTAIFAAKHNPQTKYTTDKGVQLLLNKGVPPKKLVVGVAMYGRGWTGVHGITDPTNPLTGKGTGPVKGTWEPGCVDYRDIVNTRTGGGWKHFYDKKAEGPLQFNESTGDLITYDDPKSARAKGKYVLDNGLGGLMSWEIDADNGDLLNAMHEGLGDKEGKNLLGPGGVGGGGSNPTPPPTPNPNPTPTPNPNPNPSPDHNRAPKAVISTGDQEVVGPTTLSLDGSSSSDPDGDTLSFKWTQTSGSSVSIANSNSSRASVTIPAVTSSQTYNFELTVRDAKGLTSTARLVISNHPEEDKTPSEPDNKPPTVALQSSLKVTSGQTFSLSATASDPENQHLTFNWTMPPNFKLVSGDNTKTISVKAPKVTASSEGIIRLSVSDGKHSASASTRILVQADVSSGGGGEGDDGANIPPCEKIDSQASDEAPYDNGKVYNTGDKCSFHDLRWEAKWWVQGTEPALGVEAWKLLSIIEVPWQADLSYDGGVEVNFGRKRYRAKWWVKGEEPTSSSAWEEVGTATCV